MTDNNDTLRHAKQIRQFELEGENEAPIHAESDASVILMDNGRGERFLYIVDGEDNAGYVRLSELQEMDLERGDVPEKTPDERVEDHCHERHGVLGDSGETNHS